MAITSAVQRGAFVYIYNEKFHQTGIVDTCGGSLQGFSGSSITVKRNNLSFLYDERGRQTAVLPG